MTSLNAGNMQLLESSRMKSSQFSFVVPTRDNRAELESTLRSLRAEAPPYSEIIVVESSVEPISIDDCRRLLGEELIANILIEEPKGVFAGLNAGVGAAKGQWIATITAGDSLVAGAQELLEGIASSCVSVHVFSQEVTDPSGHYLYLFRPDRESVWPHQSVLMRREVYEAVGLYSTSFKYSADQQYFAIIRKSLMYEIHGDVLTSYRLGGMSSGMSLRHCQEIYQLRRSLGSGVFSALWRVASSAVRYVLESVVGYRATASLKAVLYPVIRRAR